MDRSEIKNYRKNLKVSDRLILSLDVPDKNMALSVLSEAQDSVSCIKIGLELIYNEGLEIVRAVKNCGFNILLDAKLMDIPNTVSAALRGICRLDVRMVTIHASGGASMLHNAVKTAAEESLKSNSIRPLIFAVTILTSLDDNDLKSIGYKDNFNSAVLNLAGVAVNSKVDGIICSPNEVRALREKLGYDFLIATPGIRLENDDTQDQKRVSTPMKAISDGADFVIAGRSIINSKNIKETIKIFNEQIESGL